MSRIGRPCSVAVLAAALSCSTFQAAEPSCEAVRFRGDVREGESFEHLVAPGLLFRLAASPDPDMSGWTIEIRSPELTPPDDELTWVASPPFRFWNPRYLDTSYGRTAEAAVAVTERAFSYVRPSDRARAEEAVRALLWPAQLTDEQLEAAERTFEEIERLPGVLRITSAEVQATQDGRGRISSLDFEVELCGRESL